MKIDNPVLLTLILPVELEDGVIETLLEHPELAPGFSTAAIAGHGKSVLYAGTAEHVRGCAAYCRIELVHSRSDADALLALLRERFATDRVVYWITPVLACGRLN